MLRCPNEVRYLSLYIRCVSLLVGNRMPLRLWYTCLDYSITTYTAMFRLLNYYLGVTSQCAMYVPIFTSLYLMEYYLNLSATKFFYWSIIYNHGRIYWGVGVVSGVNPPRISLTPLIKCSTPPKFRFTPTILCERL
jgi:hypothetical protein